MGRVQRRFAILLVSLILLTGITYLLNPSLTRSTYRERNDLNRSTKLIELNTLNIAREASLTFVQQDKQEQSNADDNHSQPPACSLAFLKQYAHQHGRYPRMPFSQVGNVLTSPPVGHYDCWFDDSDRTPTKEASTCSDNVTSIVLLGDSNGRYYATNLVQVLSDSGWTCKKINEENESSFQPDPTYYTREQLITLSDIQYKKRPCQSCVSFKVQCTRVNGKTLHFEYLSFPLFNDSLVTSKRTRTVTFHVNQTFTFNKISSVTQQEFIFNEYLVGRYPDVVIFFTSSHVLYPLNNVKPHAQFCFDTLDRYLPPKSRVILASGMKQQFRVGYIIPTLPKKRFHGNLTGNDVQLLLNDGGYAGAQSRLAHPAKRWYAFPNLFDHDIAGATDHMYVDHIHRTPAWYKSIMRYMLQLLCVL